MDTRAVHIVSREAQWTQLWPRIQFQVYVIHLVCSKGTIVSNPHLHTVKSCPEKNRLIKNGDYMHSVMVAIVHSYKLDWKFMVRTRLVFAKTVTYQHLLSIRMYVQFYPYPNLNPLTLLKNVNIPNKFIAYRILLQKIFWTSTPLVIRDPRRTLLCPL